MFGKHLELPEIFLFYHLLKDNFVPTLSLSFVPEHDKMLFRRVYLSICSIFILSPSIYSLLTLNNIVPHTITVHLYFLGVSAYWAS